ncbi:hypothetical protein H6P81_003881 [Aristolochia fimbriata]|uniref:Uncharacterized protein n=1 Tax=Aristolochia fimbriata TaxID=158543 RepID=A0AAV7FEN8_ARIFI|nr:hypothetical protein H6P81_003881 [Aristolochia fimbriata]
MDFAQTTMQARVRVRFRGNECRARKKKKTALLIITRASQTKQSRWITRPTPHGFKKMFRSSGRAEARPPGSNVRNGRAVASFHSPSPPRFYVNPSSAWGPGRKFPVGPTGARSDASGPSVLESSNESGEARDDPRLACPEWHSIRRPDPTTLSARLPRTRPRSDSNGRDRVPDERNA